MTLLDRLKPEFRKQLDDSGKDFPITVENIKMEMSRSVSYTELKFSSILNILTHITRKPLTFGNIHNLFNEPKNN